MVQVAQGLGQDANAEPQGGPYAWYVVGVLILAYAVSFIDRQILSLMVGPIRKSLQISDFQLSLLHGIAFALFYSVLGIPIGRMIDRRKRTTIIATGIVVWSLMTALCGAAKNFTQLFLARIGVGVGEAALSPGAYSIIADYFPARQLSLALSFYLGAAYIGSGLATMAGGALIALMPAVTLPVVGPLEPWQAVFVAVGLPGLLVALIVLTLREPPRSGKLAAVQPSLGKVFGHIGQHGRAYALIMVGFGLSSLMWNGSTAWFPTYFMRIFGWSASEVGWRYGAVIMVAGTAGALSGGVIASWLRNRGMTDANVRTGLIALAIAMPAGISACFAPSGWSALALVFVFLFGCCMPWGAAAAALQEITPNQMRGQVSAVYLFTLNLIGLGIGPALVAGFTDYLFASDVAVGRSIALTVAITAPLSALLLWRGCVAYRQVLAAMPAPVPLR